MVRLIPGSQAALENGHRKARKVAVMWQLLSLMAVVTAKERCSRC
jgi:hypothetical protein